MDMRDDTKKVVRTLWSWLRGPSRSTGRDADEPRDSLTGPASSVCCIPPRSDARHGSRTGTPALVHDHAGKSAVVLAFPLRGEALLVRLAELLRRRVADRATGSGMERDPLLLMMSRSPGSRSRYPGSRLSIDRCAYVEFDTDRSAYRVAIEAAPDTTISLDTTDFDAVVNFVVQYVAERRSAQTVLEVAS
jgi:hypothetical protein